ncbi:MAG: haloacid dehalogenase type II [Actinomycetes bacterium]
MRRGRLAHTPHHEARAEDVLVLGEGMSRILVFDVNETLSDLSPMQQRFADVGAPEELAPLWFAQVLRDGFALAVTGEARPFATLAGEVAGRLLTSHGHRGPLEDAVQHLMSGFLALPVHPDVVSGMPRLAAAGHRLVTLSNGSTDVAAQLLDRAGVRGHVDQLLSVEAAGIWKPGRGAYEYAARELGCGVGELTMVAVHPWDLHGAARAGLATVYVDRDAHGYPDSFAAPTWTVSGLDELTEVLAGEAPSGS